MNQVVAANLRKLREEREMTQKQVAERLAEVSGRKYTKSMISAMESGIDPEKRRVFDAHELLILARAFELPITWFLVPPDDFLTRRIDVNDNVVGILVLPDIFGTEASEQLLTKRLGTISRTFQPVIDVIEERRAALRKVLQKRNTLTDTVIDSRADEMATRLVELATDLNRWAHDLWDVSGETDRMIEEVGKRPPHFGTEANLDPPLEE